MEESDEANDLAEEAEQLEIKDEDVAKLISDGVLVEDDSITEDLE